MWKARNIIMIHQVFIGKIENGQLHLADKQKFNLYISQMQGEVELTIKKRRKLRTTGKAWEKSNQNGYYWGVVIPIIQSHPQFMGWNKQEIHEGIKNKFLRIGGTDEFPKVRGTSTLNTQEWEETMSNIRMWASDMLEIYIPLPNEVSWE